jgi:hypothetical protein
MLPNRTLRRERRGPLARSHQIKGLVGPPYTELKLDWIWIGIKIEFEIA